MSHPFRAILRWPCLALTLAAHASGQCTISWPPGDAIPGVYGDVHTVIEWDPDGSGPLPEHVVAAGNWMPAAGSALTNSIAMWNPITQQWSALGNGMNGYVDALATLPTGELVATGGFTIAGQSTVNRIAKWDGITWSPLGTGLDGPGHALVVLPNGDLLVGGSFTTAGGANAPGLARWTGSSWNQVLLSFNGWVRSLSLTASGDVLVGGSFTFIGTTPANNLVRWDGTNWNPIGNGPGGTVQSVVEMTSGDYVAVGDFGSTSVARWQAATSTWSLLGDGRPALNGIYRAAAVALPNDEVVIAGQAPSYDNIQHWNGTAWTDLGAGLVGNGQSVFTGHGQGLFVRATGELLAAGRFSQAGSNSAYGVAQWDGTSWSTLNAPGTTLNGEVHDLATMIDGSIIAVGEFTHAGSQQVNHIARQLGSTWYPIGAGFERAPVSVAVRPNGQIVAAGRFSSAGGSPSDGLAGWQGSGWTSIGTPAPANTSRPFEDLAIAPNGDVVLGGRFVSIDGVACNGVARWDGTNWFALGNGLTSSSQRVRAVAVADDGQIAAAGTFPGRVAVWDGTSWTVIGTNQPSTIATLLWLPGGQLVAGSGSVFGGSGTVSMWDGTSWQPLGAISDDVEDLVRLPNGDLLAAGSFTDVGGISMPRVARWDGATWSGFGAGLNEAANSITLDNLGLPVFGGRFTSAGNNVSAFVARLTTSCPASSYPAGTGCGTATTNVDVPWIGSTWRARVAGMPTNSLAVLVNGLQPMTLPLNGLVANTAATCLLRVQPDYVAGIVTTNGTATFEAPIANNPALVGATFWHQTLAMSLTPGFQVTANDAVLLTVGSF